MFNEKGGFFKNKEKKKEKSAEKKMSDRELLEENLRFSKKIYRYIIWRRVLGTLKILIILIPIILGFIYLPSLIEDTLGHYQEFLGGFENMKAGLEGAQGDVNVQGSGSIDINSLLKQYEILR